jgi:regulator of sirC expression with transglutaminase-like and TPR domain
MNLSLDVPTPLEYFATLVQSDADFPLLEAAISLGQDEYPELDVQQVLGEVDQLLARLKRRIPVDAGPLQKLRAVNQFFFKDLNFAGNANNYYDPDNSYVSVILRTRLAIPISLAVLWMELAQGLGLAARGVGFPGHFMLKVNLPEGQVVIDPMDGHSLSREQLSERLLNQGLPLALGDDVEVPLGLYLQMSPSRDIIARMLRNLKEIHAAQEDWPRMISVLNRLVILLPGQWSLHRERGLALAETGQTERALQDLETYLDNTESGEGRKAIALRVIELRQLKH